MIRPCTPAPPAAFAALVMVALLGSPTVAPAAQPCETTVYYKLHDLATDRGVRALYWRIADAAKMVCPPEEPRNLWQLVQSRDCQRQAIRHAVAKIGNPRLASMYAQMLAPHG